MQRLQWISVMVLLISGLSRGCDQAPPEIPVEIPDKAFLGTLLAQGVDSNGDGRISQEEAKATRSLLVPPSGISDLTGLEAFIHLDSFSITLNPLKHMEISALGNLRYLECTSCEITSLDVSLNTSLESLICGRNSLEVLDLSGNPSLTTLVCNNNLFTDLDLSVNTALSTMISCGNQLTSLDISRNTALTKIGCDNMPMLTEVCVWTLPFPPAGVVVLREFSPNVVYTASCSE